MKPQFIEKEKNELERVVQDLRRDESIKISYNEVYDAFLNAKEVKLTDDIWNVLENTESNEIEVGDMKSVEKIAHMYHKTNPTILAKAIKSGDYDRPMILNYEGDRYVLVAGNTRLCTAKALGINPKVYIATMNANEIEEIDLPYDPDEDETQNIHPSGISDWKNRKKKVETKEMTGAASAGAYSTPLFTTTKKKLKEAMEASSSGQFDVPAFGTSTKGRKNPLKIDGPESIYKGRAVKDKKFPKWGGPKSVFVKVKDKCKKYPYCNEGPGAIEIFNEMSELKEAVEETSKKYGIPYQEVQKIVLNEINKIFI